MNTMVDIGRMVFDLGPGEHRIEMNDAERALLTAFCKAYNARAIETGVAKANVVAVVSDNVYFGRKMLLVKEHEIKIYDDLNAGVNTEYVRARIRMMNDGDSEQFLGDADFVGAVRVICSNSQGKYTVKKTEKGCLVSKGLNRASKKGDIVLMLANYTKPIAISSLMDVEAAYVRTVVSGYNAKNGTQFSVNGHGGQLYIAIKEVEKIAAKSCKEFIPKAVKDALVKITYKGALTEEERIDALDALAELEDIIQHS